MRLIDADEFIVNLKDYIDKPMTAGLCGALVELAPTAYDVDKVVEELKKHKDTTDLNTVDEEMVVGFTVYQGAFNDAIDKSIEIVKQGSASDDVCEYRITDKVVYASCNNKQIASAFCCFDECGDYKYCPYCGKRIKVVE